MYRLFLALRYLLTRPINLLGMLGIAVSVWALVVVVSLFTGFLAVLEQHLQSASADLTVTALPQWAEWSALEPQLRDDDNVAGAAPRLVHHGIVQKPGQRTKTPPLPGRTSLSGGEQPFVFVIGIDATAEAGVTGLSAWLADPAIAPELRVADRNQPFAGDDARPRVLVGQERMARDGWRPGDEVRWTFATVVGDADGNRTVRQHELALVVAGAYRTHHFGFDGNNVFVPIATLREVLSLRPGSVHEVVVAVRDEHQLDATADRLARATARALDRGNGFLYGSVQTWRERNQGELESVAHQRSLLKIVLVVIMVVAAFLMLATLSMMVTEKVADIGILTALGGTPLGVTQVFLACGLSITVVGLALGLAGGALTSIYLEEIRQALLATVGVDLFPVQVYNLDRVPSRLDPWWMGQVAGMALATGFLVSALPALRAARHDPLVSLRGS